MFEMLRPHNQSKHLWVSTVRMRLLRLPNNNYLVNNILCEFSESNSTIMGLPLGLLGVTPFDGFNKSRKVAQPQGGKWADVAAQDGDTANPGQS